MSKRNTFFQSVSALYHGDCVDALDHILSETDDLLSRIQYQQQVQAPFWSCFLSDDKQVVQVCRNCAGYFGRTPDELVGLRLMSFAAQVDVSSAVLDTVDQAQVTGEVVVEIFPNRYGGRFGIVICPLPWMHEEMGTALGLVWPLPRNEDWFQFEFRSFVGLRGFLVIDAQSNILAVDQVVARRLGSTPDNLLGRNYFDFMASARDCCNQRAIIREALWTGRTSTWIGGNEGSGRQYELFQVPFFKDGAVSQIVILGRELLDSGQEVELPAQVRVIE